MGREVQPPAFIWRTDMLRSEDYEKDFTEESGVPKEELRAQQQEQENEEKEPVPAQSEQYRNFIVRYNQNIHGLTDYESDRTFQIINERFGIIYAPAQQVPELEFTSYTCSSIPKCFWKNSCKFKTFSSTISFVRLISFNAQWRVNKSTLKSLATNNISASCPL